MINRNSQSIILQSLDFVKDNYADFTKVILKYGILVPIFILIPNFIVIFIKTQKYELPFDTIACTITWLLILNYLSDYLNILVTRKILNNENREQLTFYTQSPLTKLYGRIWLKLWIVSYIYILGIIILFISKFLLPLVINKSISDSLIIVYSVIILLSLIKFITLNTDIIANNKIRIGFNIQLTKNNFLECFKYFLLKNILILMVSSIIIIFINIILAMTNNISIGSETFYFYIDDITSNEILYPVILFVSGIILIHISVFNHALTTYLYIKLMRQSGLELTSLSMPQPNLLSK